MRTIERVVWKTTRLLALEYVRTLEIVSESDAGNSRVPFSRERNVNRVPVVRGQVLEDGGEASLAPQLLAQLGVSTDGSDL